MTDTISFREKIIALRQETTTDLLNATQSPDFWYVVDSISDDLIYKWADRASKIKNPIHGKWIGDEWLQLNQILNYHKTYNAHTQLPWSKKQKRFCVMMIVKFWDDLEMMYYC